MLTREENELVTNTNPGTPMGELFRRFWLPVLLSSELPGPDCDPMRVRVLGEDLIAFRDTDGRPGLVDAYCPHRGAPMFFGRNEESGIRCVYHGWKFDVEGTCIDLPNAPEGETFKNKVTITAYPTVDKGDLIWAYMGPKDKQPPLPGFDWLDMPTSHRYVSKFRLECNYLQAMEGDYDPSHGMFLHTTLDNNQSNPAYGLTGAGTVDQSQFRATRTLKQLGDFGHSESDSGLIFTTVRMLPDGRKVANASPWMMPIFPTAGQSGAGTYASNIRVPIDNTSLMFYRLRWRYDPIPEKELWYYKSSGYTFPELIPGTWKTKANVFNDYDIDRVAQRNYSFTGIKSFPLQDIAMMENQWGPIAERTKEHLTSSDVQIIGVRRRLIKLARELMEGKEPVAPWKPEAFKYHIASVIVSADTPDEEVIAKVRERVMTSGIDSLPLVLEPAARAGVR